MRSLTKKIFILGLFIFTTGILVACGNNNTTENTTDILEDFNMDEVYYQDDYYEITYKDLYNSVKVNDGIDRLLEIVDTALLSEYFDDITQAEIEEKREKLIYDTNDQEVIADFDEDEVQRKETAYENGMYILGYADDDTPYLRLLVARDKYITDLLTNEDFIDKNLFISPNSVAEYYERTNRGSVDAIMIRFDSLNEAKAILTENDLVSYNGEIRLYIDTEVPLENQPSYKIDDTNTRSLSDEELLSFFIDFYNQVYQGSKPALLETATMNDLIGEEELNYTYSDLQDINSLLGRLLFDNLSAMNEDTSDSFYTYTPYEVEVRNGNKYYLILSLNLDHYDLSDFDGDESDLKAIIGDDLYDELYQEILDKNLNDENFVAKHLKTFREDNGFDILDYYLFLDYESVVPDDKEPNDLNSFSDVIAIYNDSEITVGDLLIHSLERKAPLYLVHAAQLQILSHHHYEDVYCIDQDTCEYDYNENESVAMSSHMSQLFELETGFESSMYANYFSFDDYLYLAYGAKSNEDMIENNYVKKALEPLYIYDYILENKDTIINDIIELIQPYYDNYFSLDVNHILIFIDENNDSSPDDFDDYYEELDNQSTFDNLVEDFRRDIVSYLRDNDDDLANFVSEYNIANRNDTTWGRYKRAGLNVLTENLSKQGSLNYINSYRKFDDSFVEGLSALYNEYQKSANIDKDFIYDQNLIKTAYGLHLVKAEKGDNFDMPSAQFSIDEDDDYSTLLENENDIINYSQISIYLDYRLFEITESYIDVNLIYEMDQPNIPSDLLETLNFFLAEVHDSYYSVGYLNAAMVNELIDGELVNQSNDIAGFSKAEIDAFMLEIKEIYVYQIESQFNQ